MWQTPKCAAVLSISAAALARAAARPLSTAAELLDAVELTAEPATELSPPAAAAAAASTTTTTTGASAAGEDALVCSSPETLTLEDLGGGDGATLLLLEVKAIAVCGVDDDEL